jgi:type II restriction enzyme
MKLDLDATLGEGYSSASQWARRVTEGWAAQNLYCPACTSPRLSSHVNNRAVEDYHCPRCARQVQVKAKNGKIGSTISNSAFKRKEAAVLANRAPDYCFMAYSRDDLVVNDVLWVPGHFMTMSVISARKPLRQTARRSGWIGSNIHLDLIPTQGKIVVVEAGRPVEPDLVRRQFEETAFVSTLPPEKRGWVTDVLACIDSLDVRPGAAFTNGDVYGCEERLQKLHPANHNIRPKIRQQLQVLARHGIVARTKPGTYRRL